MPRQQAERTTGADYLLLFLYLNGKEPIKSAVRLTKMMFLFEKEVVPILRKKGATIDDSDLPDFRPYDYGPFSKDVYEQVELFQSIEFIRVRDLKVKEEMSEVDDWEEPAFLNEMESQDYENCRDGKFMQYELLPQGELYVNQKIKDHVGLECMEILSKFKTKIIRTPIKAILRYVYTTYPEMTEKSLIKKQVLGNGEG